MQLCFSMVTQAQKKKKTSAPAYIYILQQQFLDVLEPPINLCDHKSLRENSGDRTLPLPRQLSCCSNVCVTDRGNDGCSIRYLLLFHRVDQIIKTSVKLFSKVIDLMHDVWKSSYRHHPGQGSLTRRAYPSSSYCLLVVSSP